MCRGLTQSRGTTSRAECRSLGGFSRLTNKPFSPADLKIRVKQAGQRRTLGYFTERKFADAGVVGKLEAFGFVPGNYGKVIVSWGWEADVPEAAARAGIELWDFRAMLKEIGERGCEGRTYFTDDTVRTLQLMAMVARS